MIRVSRQLRPNPTSSMETSMPLSLNAATCSRRQAGSPINCCSLISMQKVTASSVLARRSIKRSLGVPRIVEGNRFRCNLPLGISRLLTATQALRHERSTDASILDSRASRKKSTGISRAPTGPRLRSSCPTTSSPTNSNIGWDTAWKLPFSIAVVRSSRLGGFGVPTEDKAFRGMTASSG